ncbi:MAG: hypothetical protein ABI650_06755 [Dokdonella sp.]
MTRVLALAALLVVLAAGVWLLRDPPVAVSQRAPPAAVEMLPPTRPLAAELPSLPEQPLRVEQRVEALADVTTHAAPALRGCLADTGKVVRERTVAVHRWVDEQGIIHFSDTAPGVASVDHRVIEVTGVPPISVRASGHDVNLPAQLQQRAISDAQAIERILRNALGVEGDPGLALDIVFVQEAQAYATFVPTPALAGSDGAYSPRERTIYVRWQARDEDNFTIVRHEIAHALVHERIGNLPVAINEGLAGFFERVEVYGLGAQVALQGEQRALREATVSSEGGDELVDLLARDTASFYAPGREIRYLRAFALVATLMEQAQGRAALGALLAAQRADSCHPVDVGGLLDEHYPGGLTALAADWARWLRNPPATVHAY